MKLHLLAIPTMVLVFFFNPELAAVYFHLPGASVSLGSSRESQKRKGFLLMLLSVKWEEK